MKIRSLTITTPQKLMTCIADIKIHKPEIVAFDTEGNGLNIKFHKPFVITFGFLTNDNKTIYTYAFDFEHNHRQLAIDVMYVVNKMIKKAKKCFGHNITFDWHMLNNINFPINYKKNGSDTQIYIRLGNDPIIPEDGGIVLDLKGYAVRKLSSTARSFQSKLRIEQKQIRTANTHILKSQLKHLPVLDKFRVTGTERAWTKKMIDTFFEDKINDIYDLPKEVREIVQEWKNNMVDPDNYQNLNRENVILYAHYDIVYTLQVYLNEKENLVEREQQETLKIEEDAILGLYELEKTGVYIDLEYTQKSRLIIKTYIKELRNELVVLLQQKVRVGQFDLVRRLLSEHFKLDLPNTQKKTLKNTVSQLKNEKAKRALQIIIELRSLEKWYSTYIVRWLEEAQKFNTNMLYPTYHQCGAVTGRVSSPFQQFPKDPKYTIDGEILFHPRAMFTTPPNADLVYFDYNAMELRIQAIYTILIDEPDKNLCRAYIPFECTQRDNKWYLNEDPEIEWIPVDVHEATAYEAFGLKRNEPGGEAARNKGKTGNFAIIYGAVPTTLERDLGLSKADSIKVYNGFFKAFPKIRAYAAYVQGCIMEYGYAQNLLGRKYHNISAHKAKNYLIQGTGADYTKSILPKIIKLIEPYKTQIQGYLHDEYSFIIPPDERHLIPKIKNIMEELESPIKLEVNIEISSTNWSEKHDYVIPQEHSL